jgi:predicted nucleic acid-binding protein
LYLDTIVRLMDRVDASDELIELALGLYERDQLSWYDTLIVAAAIRAGCETLYSEDGPTGQVIGGVRLVDPFAAV